MTSSVSSSVDIISNALVKRTQIVRVEMEMASDLDVEDPDVQRSFLQQIEQRLKAKGLRAVQLSWRKQPDGKVFHKKKNDKKKEKRDEF
ncbi:uncharacterized protein LOC134442435 [Engraulis encrasicolus]|uniref:uncharacterized protein LOC134442435 n=1 Tax=Engraulis encrasicolus TaxID=184585 RepID=UPI002FCF8B18